MNDAKKLFSSSQRFHFHHVLRAGLGEIDALQEKLGDRVEIRDARYEDWNQNVPAGTESRHPNADEPEYQEPEYRP